MIHLYLDSVIGDAILKAIYTAVWGMFIQGPLQLISQFNQILVWLASGVIFALIFGNKKLDGTDTFTFSGIPSVFWGFCILAFFVLVVIFMIQYFKIIHSDVAKMKPALFEALKGSGKALLFIFIIPFAFFVANELIVFLNNGTQIIFGAQNANIADVLYHLGDAGWDGTSGAPSNYGVPGNVLEYNMFIQIIGTYFFVYALIMTGLALTGKVIELFILFITGPIVFAKMPNDGGQAAGVWKNLCITKLIASWGTLTSYSCFTMAISLLLKNGLSDFSGIGRIVAMLFFVCGGAVSILGVSAMIANFVGESVGAMEGAASLRSTIAAGGMMFAASRKAGQILGFGKNAVNAGGQKRGFFSKMFGRPSGGSYDSQDFSRADSVGISESVIPRNSFQNRTGLMAAVGSTIGGISSIWAARNAAGSLKGVEKGSAEWKSAKQARNKAGWSAFGKGIGNVAGNVTGVNKVKDGIRNIKESTKSQYGSHKKSYGKDTFSNSKIKK